MIELLSALVANGTTAFNWGYEPWLPFNEFIPVTIALAIVVWYFTKDRFLSIMFLVSEATALIPTWAMWSGWSLKPSEVFIVWIMSTVIMFVVQLWLLDYLARKSGFELVRPYDEMKKEEEKKS